MSAQIIYAVFHGDGCECEDLVGVFDSTEAAEEVRADVEARIRHFYTESMSRHQWRGSVSVRPLEIGKVELPADAIA
jgi:hypothetical protein